MKTSARGRKLVETFEGCRLAAYRDSVGVLTIGYGHTHGVRPGQRITQAQADALLGQDLEWAESAVNALELPLSQPQFDATVSFVFNLGAGILGAGHDFGRLLRGRQWRAAADSMLEYSDPGRPEHAGLLRRRKAERALFLSKPVSHKLLVWRHELAQLRARARKSGWTKPMRVRGRKLKALIAREGKR